MDAALATAARRKVRRAVGLLNEATRELAELAEGADVVGVLRCQDAGSRADVADLVRVAVERYGAADVIVVARPRRRTPTTGRKAEGGSNGRPEASTTDALTGTGTRQ